MARIAEKKYNDKEWLKKQYIDNEMTQREIGELCGVSYCSITNAMKRLGIPARPCNQERFKVDKEWLEREYLEKRKSQKEIADICGVSQGTISNRMRQLSIPTRLGRREGFEIELKAELLEFLDGLLLGDGYLANREVSICYSHSDKNKGFLEWLKRMFEDFGFSTSKIRKDRYKNCKAITYRIHSRSYRNLMVFYERWYGTGEKKIPDDFEYSPTKILLWYLGDGSFDKSGKHCIITSFNLDIDGVFQYLNLRGISVTKQVGGNVLYVRVRSLPHFFKYILSSNIEIPKCYHYKFPEDMIL